MRIDVYNQVNSLYGVNKSKKTSRTSAYSSVNTTDQVSFSSIGKDMQIAKVAVANAPDVRQDKVDEVKASIAQGTYQVSPESFAEKLMAAYQGR